MSQKSWINYHHLLYFKTIAMEGGIANAAKKLRLGQPTLSTQLKQFEETLGHQLFDRSKRKLQLTEAGRLVLEYATDIFKIGEEMLDSLNDQHHASKILVQVGVVDTIPKHSTFKIYRMAQENIRCIVSLISGHHDELLRELRAHRIDLMVANYPPPVTEASGFYSKSIEKVPIVVCGAKKFASLKRNFPESLSYQPFVMPSPQTKIRHDVEHYLKLRNIFVDMVAEVQDTAVQKLLAVHGEGLVPLSLQAAQEHIDNRELVLIGTLHDLTDELWLIAAQRRIQNPIAAAIMRELEK